MRAEINENLLTAEERMECNRRRRGPLTNREQWNPRIWVPTLLPVGLSLVCLGGVWYTTRNLEVQADGNDADTFAFLVGAFICMGLFIAAAVKGTRALRAHLVDTYLSSVAERLEHEDLRRQIQALTEDWRYVCDNAGDCAPYTVMDGVDYGVDLNLHVSHIGFVKERRAAGEQALRENTRIELSSFLERWGSTAPPHEPYVHDYDSSDDYYVSKRQRDHLWYGDHSDLDWRDRERGQSWGMDADTYVSNWLENDKD